MNKIQADTKSFIETQCRIAGCAREAEALSKGYSVIVEGCFDNGGADDDIADEISDFGNGYSLDNHRVSAGGNNGGADDDNADEISDFGNGQSLDNHRALTGSNDGGADDDNAFEISDFGNGHSLEYGA